MVSDLVPLSERIFEAVARKAPLAPQDLQTMTGISRRIPGLGREMNEIHQIKIRRLLEESRQRMALILGFYGAFVVIGSLLIGAGSYIFSRKVVWPLKQLASATLELARGNLQQRVPVASKDEIGLLSQSFNVMAERLERKVREAEALYRIGTEIAALLHIDRVIELVVSQAQTLLHADGAGLALMDEATHEITWRIFLGGELEAFKRIRLRPGQGVAGRVVSMGRPVLIEDLSKSQDPADAPEANPILALYDLRSALAVPLKRGEKTLETLMVGNRAPTPFTEEQVVLLTSLANQAVVAIENARLYEEVQVLAALRERERIAREMHDSLAQALGSLLLTVRGAALKDLPDQHRRALQGIEKIAEEAYTEVRQSIFGLRTMVTRSLGLIPTLAEYLHEFSDQSGIAIDLQVPQEAVIRLSPQAEVQLIRIIQEALTNVRRHAHARGAWVSFKVQGEGLEVVVGDDGQGFDVAGVQARGRGHFGLQAMRERAQAIGGTLDIETAPGKGTKVVVTLPLLA